MASSTTRPMASTRPKSDRVLIEKPSKREDGKGADEGDRNGKGRNEGRPPALEEDEDHEDDEGQGHEERFDDLMDPFVDGPRRVEGNAIVEIGGKSLLGLFHQLLDALDGGEGIRSRATGRWP